MWYHLAAAFKAAGLVDANLLAKPVLLIALQQVLGKSPKLTMLTEWECQCFKRCPGLRVLRANVLLVLVNDNDAHLINVLTGLIVISDFKSFWTLAVCRTHWGQNGLNEVINDHRLTRRCSKFWAAWQLHIWQAYQRVTGIPVPGKEIERKKFSLSSRTWDWKKEIPVPVSRIEIGFSSHPEAYLHCVVDRRRWESHWLQNLKTENNVLCYLFTFGMFW